MSRSKKELQSGALQVEIELDDAGNLVSIRLPKRVPENLATQDLAGMLDQLAVLPRVADVDSFRSRVWKHMSKIPWGHAMTYQELAAKAGSPKASRAVGQACAKNPLPLIVPCHRVLASDNPGGYAYGPEWKAMLLALETEPRPAAKD